jgi:anti-anti-sigma factor
MEPSAGSLLDDASEHSRDVVRSPRVLDHAASAELRVAISRKISHGSARLVIDLAAVTDVDSEGFAVLIYACRAATAAHVSLVLSSPSSFLLQLLEPMRLSASYDIDLKPAPPVPIRGTTA